MPDAASFGELPNMAPDTLDIGKSRVAADFPGLSVGARPLIRQKSHSNPQPLDDDPCTNLPREFIQ